MKKNRLLLFIPLLWVSGCSNEQENNPPPEQSYKAQIFKEQTDALEKAKQVEQMLQQGADRNRQIIEEQSK